MAPADQDTVDLYFIAGAGNDPAYRTDFPTSKIFAWSTVARAQLKAPGYHGERIISPKLTWDLAGILTDWLNAVDTENPPELSIAALNAATPGSQPREGLRQPVRPPPLGSQIWPRKAPEGQ